MTDATPITFTKAAYALFDVDENAVLTTVHGNMAIFSTRGVAELWAAQSTRRIKVMAVRIRPEES